MRKLALVVALLAGALVPGAGRAETFLQDADAYASVTESGIELGNAFVRRVWERERLRTVSIFDSRAGLSLPGVEDFTVDVDGVRFGGSDFQITAVTASRPTRGGVAVTFEAEAPGLRVSRRVEVFPGIAGFKQATTLQSASPVVISAYEVDRLAPGTAVTATVHSFRAGADWREPSWAPFSIGDSHTGDWRDTRSSARGTSIVAPGQWISLEFPGGSTAFAVLERRDYASSVMGYDGTVAAAGVDLSRDLVYTGPFEEDIHTENPGPGPGRARVLNPTKPLELEPSFLGFGSSSDDEAWQHYRYLTGHRLTPYKKAVTFNTNNIDTNRISTGAKDDVDYATFLQLLAAAREMGVETFIFDDGWQARSGDWCPDSPECPEPRWNGSPTSQFKPRFPDATFSAVSAQLAGEPSTAEDDIDLGLWWTPMEFHPSSDAYRRNPQWACAPVGHGTATLSILQPDSSSNEAGLGVWNPNAVGLDPQLQPQRMVDYMRGRIQHAIDVYGARYFKFDFLVWIDCIGAEPSDIYDYHDSFVKMVDTLQAVNPQVTFQVDETNDYRMFPFESVARGPSWFQNGTPPSRELLHNVWNLAPFVPGFSIGQHALGNRGELSLRGADYLMAVALPSHITFWTNISTITPADRARVKKWTDFYRVYRDEIAQFTLPLLSDPRGEAWTALQPWNPETGRGFVLAYRQAAGNSVRRIPLRLIGDGTYSLTRIDPATGAVDDLGLFDRATLEGGIDVEISEQWGYALIRMIRVAGS